MLRVMETPGSLSRLPGPPKDRFVFSSEMTHKKRGTKAETRSLFFGGPSSQEVASWTLKFPLKPGSLHQNDGEVPFLRVV